MPFYDNCSSVIASVARFPRATLLRILFTLVFPYTRYMLQGQLIYMHGYRPGRVELLCLSSKKNVFILNPIIVFVYRCCCVYSFIFCISCIVKMLESSRRGSLLPHSRWLQWGGGRSTSLSHTSLDLTPSTACTGSHVAGGWEGGGEGFREVIVPVSLPPPHRVFPFLHFHFLFLLVYIVISLRLGFSSGFFPN